jgi:hypothetical protein
MDRTLAERLTLILSYMAHRGGYDEPYSLIRTSYEDGNWKDNVGLLFQDLTRNGFGSIRHLDFQTLIDQCTDALKSAGDEAHLPTLVNTIVELLQHPYAQNALAGDTLKRLRKAVLFPEELAKVSANAHLELRCSSCGKPFTTGDMCTFVGDERHAGFACSRCQHPVSAGCNKYGCENSGQIDSKAMSKLVAKADCGQHIDMPKLDAIPEEVRRGIIEENPFVANIPAPPWERQQVGRPPAAIDERRMREAQREEDRLRGMRRAGR